MTTSVTTNDLSTFGYHGTLAHGPVLRNKYNDTLDGELRVVLSAYDLFIANARSISFDLTNSSSISDAIDQLTDYLNTYRGIALPILEARDNSGQENLRSSILEEFFQLLLFPLISTVRERFNDALTLGKANSYVSLTFTPRSFTSLFESPSPHIHTKDQDFVLGCSVELSSKVKGHTDDIPAPSVAQVVVPVVAIECKTYIERNMLDSCAGTAKRLKSAMPYCLYMVAAEYMKMEDAYPELTDIDEVFILTRASNSDRLRHNRPLKNV